jgi:hypothetical protein
LVTLERVAAAFLEPATGAKRWSSCSRACGGAHALTTHHVSRIQWPS